MKIFKHKDKWYVKVQTSNFSHPTKAWRSKTFKTALEALDYGANYSGDQYVHCIDAETYNYALKINHSIFKCKDFCFA
jgi:hypothetical protein